MTPLARAAVVGSRAALGALGALGALAACQSGGLGDLSDLAAEPALPYSVLVTGGAFVEPAGGAGTDPQPLERTYRPQDEQWEAVPLDAVVDVLAQARVFVRVEGDDAPAALRYQIAAQRGPVPVHAAELQEFLMRARRSGHDFLLVVERLEDGPIEARGVNGQWPITAAVWLLIGLGLVIPDHTYESKAQLRVALRDVQSGRPLYEGLLDSGLVDLSLVERTDFLGLLQSIVVPPFLVGDDTWAVEALVRDTASARLLLALARALKSPTFYSELQPRLAARLTLRLENDEVVVEAESPESLSAVRVQVDATPLLGPRLDAFAAALMGSAEELDGRWSYRARLPRPARGRHLQVLVQTVTGRVASVTAPLSP